MDPLEKALIDYKRSTVCGKVPRIIDYGDPRYESTITMSVRETITGRLESRRLGGALGSDEYSEVEVDQLVYHPQRAISIVLWIAEATASGVLGNLAYDLIKEGVAAYIRRRRLLPRRPNTRQVIKRAAVLAVVYRCQEVGMPVPKSLRTKRIKVNDTHCVVDLHSRKGHTQFKAEVHLPLSNFSRDGIEVRMIMSRVASAAEQEVVMDRWPAMLRKLNEESLASTRSPATLPQRIERLKDLLREAGDV